MRCEVICLRGVVSISDISPELVNCLVSLKAVDRLKALSMDYEIEKTLTDSKEL